jgi:hypothetical protein
MTWWGWLLVAWGTLATLAAFWLGGAARLARRREQAARAYQYENESAKRRRWWTKAS